MLHPDAGGTGPNRPRPVNDAKAEPVANRRSVAVSLAAVIAILLVVFTGLGFAIWFLADQAIDAVKRSAVRDDQPTRPIEPPGLVTRPPSNHANAGTGTREPADERLQPAFGPNPLGMTDWAVDQDKKPARGHALEREK